MRSVVVPACDRAELVRRRLDRLAPGAQDLDASRYEVVVADGRSRVSARAALMAMHPWARVVEGPRRGPAANRNAGAKAAHGGYLAFTEDDAIPAPK